MAQNYDVVILGGGTGGYVAAIRAAQLGLKTAIVERERLGGTCLHKGCIPSKALLRSAEVYRMANKTASEFGVDITGVTLQFNKVQARKQAIVEQLSQGVNTLMKKGKIDVYEGTGRILGPSIFSPMPGTISVEMRNGEENEMLVPTNVVIATGSKPRGMAGLTVDGKYVMNSDHALQMEELPTSLLIVGGGVIGIEWASMLCDFGVAVTVIEYGPTILPAEDADIVKEVTKQLENRGVRV
ncbi:Dihydrolipoyl dehydrogenase OS=Lysinibacillus sphaericus OX=1421 GN=LS41612_09215 PE=3 SV=1 [Lysinibacillus sphaericus]